MNIGDKIKVMRGQYTAWQGEVVDLYGATWVAVNIYYRDKRASTTVPPDYLQVLEPAPAPAPDVPGWEYYTPNDDDGDES